MIITINDIEINKYELLHLINSNKKIQAIKVVKIQTGLNLKDCKEIIDNLSKNQNFYDRKPFVTKADYKDLKAQSQLSKPNKGKHVIKPSTNYKNYVILFLLICFFVLLYMYYTK